MNFVRSSALSVVFVLSACGKAPPEANPDFSDAAVYSLRAFEGSEADLAFGIRALEAAIYDTMDVESDDVRDRALTPATLTDEDLEGLETPDGADPANALPVAVAGLSAHSVDASKAIQLLTDQTVVEYYSPDQYDRTFLEQTDTCWADHGCDTLITFNDLIKKNLIMEIPYLLNKDFRWVDLGLPDPSTVAEGEEPVNEGEPRWAYVARSWMTESASGEGGNTIVQSYTIETWIPRDDGGTLRFLAVWAETDLPGTPGGDNPDTIATTTMTGIENNYETQEAWLDENASR